MKTYTVIQTYTAQDIWKNVKAKDKQEAIDICIGGLPVNENKPNYTNDIFEVEEVKWKEKFGHQKKQKEQENF